MSLCLPTNKNFFVTVILIFCLLNYIVLSNVDCDESYSCSNTNILQNNKLFCNGVQACQSSDITCNDNCVFNGAYAGYLATITSNKNVLCNGVQSCKYSSDLQASQKFYCDGLVGATYSNIYVNGMAYIRSGRCLEYSNITGNGNNEIIISGSTSNAIFRSFSKYTLTGHQSLTYSQIYSNGNDITVDLDGSYSGQLGEIYCESGDTCIINCNSLSGCAYLTVYYHINSNYIGNCDSDCSFCSLFYENQYVFNTVEELKNSKLYLDHKSELMESQKQLDEYNEYNDIFDGISGIDKLDENGKIQLDEKFESFTVNKMLNNVDSNFNNKLYIHSVNNHGDDNDDNDYIMGFNNNEIISMVIGSSLTIIFSVAGYTLKKRIN